MSTFFFVLLLIFLLIFFSVISHFYSLFIFIFILRCSNFLPPVSCKYNNINGLRALSAIGIAVMHYQANLSVKPCLGWASDVLIPCIVERIHLENFILDENLLFVVTYVAGIGAAVAFSYVVRNMIDYVFLHSGHGRLRREKISKK